MSQPAFHQSVFCAVRYKDAHAAIDWLERAFGAERHMVYDADDGTVAHAQIGIAGNLIMLGETRDDDYAVRTPAEVGGVTASLYVVLPDAAAVDALAERARAAGARITAEPHDQDYGSHDFAALDVGGHVWSFGTYDPAKLHVK